VPEPAILDLRPAEAFEAGHRTGAVNIPLEQLEARAHELPPADDELLLFDADPERVRRASERLRLRHRGPLLPISDPGFLTAGPVETGPARARLWRPHAFLQDSIPLLAAAWGALAGKYALDLACGSGRDAVYLATLGMKVAAVDLLPEALERSADLAARTGVELQVLRADVEHGPPLAPAACDLVIVFNFLHRPLFAQLREAVTRGGFLIYETFLVEQRERFGKPSREAFLLQPGELRSAFAGWQIACYREGQFAPRRITAGLVARRP
jgi:hypothetical protein